MKKRIKEFFQKLFQMIKNFFCKSSKDIEKTVKSDVDTFVDGVKELLDEVNE